MTGGGDWATAASQQESIIGSHKYEHHYMGLIAAEIDYLNSLSSGGRPQKHQTTTTTTAQEDDDKDVNLVKLYSSA